MKPVKLFICHSSLDKPFVRRLKKELNSFRFDVWVDENEIKVGDSIFTAIEEALQTSDYVLLILSPNFNLSSWARSELEATFHLEKKHKTKRILPCLIKKTEIPTLISGIKYADFSKTFLNGLTELLGAIIPKNEDNPLDVYVTNSTVTLDIQDKEGRLVKYLKKCRHTSLVDHLTQFTDCFAISGSLENLVVKGERISSIRKESGMHFFEINYNHPLSKGDSEEITTTVDFINSFTELHEHWETLSNNHNADKFTVLVKFPEDRPPIDWYVEQRIGTKYTKKEKEIISLRREGSRAVLELVVENPVNFRGYILRWHW